MHVCMIDVVDDVVILDDRVFDALANRTGNGPGLCMDKTELADFFHDGTNAAGFVEILHMIRAARTHLADIGSFTADFVEGVEG